MMRLAAEVAALKKENDAQAERAASAIRVQQRLTAAVARLASLVAQTTQAPAAHERDGSRSAHGRGFSSAVLAGAVGAVLCICALFGLRSLLRASRVAPAGRGAEEQRVLYVAQAHAQPQERAAVRPPQWRSARLPTALARDAPTPAGTSTGTAVGPAAARVAAARSALATSASRPNVDDAARDPAEDMI